MPLAESILFIYLSTGNRTAADKALSAASPLLDVPEVRRRRALATSVTFCTALRENEGGKGRRQISHRLRLHRSSTY